MTDLTLKNLEEVLVKLQSTMQGKDTLARLSPGEFIITRDVYEKLQGFDFETVEQEHYRIRGGE